MGYTARGRLFHGTTLTNALSLAGGEIVGAERPNVVPGLYTFPVYAPTLEYALTRAHAWHDSPIVMEFKVERRGLRVLLLGDDLDIGTDANLTRLYQALGSVNQFWRFLAERLDLDATVDLQAPVFFQVRRLIGPRSHANVLALLQRQQARRPVIVSPAFTMMDFD